MVTLAAHLIRLISLTTLSPVSGSFQSNFPFLLMRGGSTSLSSKNVSTITLSSRRISTSQEGLSLAFFLTGRGSETVWRSSIVFLWQEWRQELRRRVCGAPPARRQTSFTIMRGKETRSFLYRNASIIRLYVACESNRCCCHILPPALPASSHSNNTCKHQRVFFSLLLTLAGEICSFE